MSTLNESSHLENGSKQDELTESESLLVSNFVAFFGPVLKNLDDKIYSSRLAQCELTNQIKKLMSEISKIYDGDKKKLELDEFIKQLVVLKKRINVIQVNLISIQERLNKMYTFAQKDPLLRQSRQSLSK